MSGQRMKASACNKWFRSDGRWNQPTQPGCYVDWFTTFPGPYLETCCKSFQLGYSIGLANAGVFFLSGLVFEFDIGIVDWKDGSWLNNYFPANITLLSRLDFCFMSFFPVKHAHVSHDTGQNCVCVCVRVTQWWSRHELLIQLTFQIFLSKVNNEVEAVVTLSATWSIKGATLWKYSHLIHYSM